MPLIFYLYGSSYKDKFNASDKITFDYKVRTISSNISLDRFYNNVDPTSVIDELIKISEPNKKEKIIFVWPEGIIPNISQKELIKYNWLFKESFNYNHLLIIGINSQKSDNQNV